MRLLTGKNIGFCFGVERAISIAREAAGKHIPVYTYGELIHNLTVIKDLRKDGIIPVQSPEEIPPGGTVIIRSHGVGPDVLLSCRERGLEVVDATCPFVKRIHKIVREQEKKGCSVVIFGQAGHPEVQGIQGWCLNPAVISLPKDAAALHYMEKACLVSQTTASLQLFNAAAAELKKRCKELTIYNTICETTSVRQKETEELSRMCSRMVVVGGHHSSNTQKLCAICKKYCKNVDSIAELSEISLENIYMDDIIGVVGGASTPKWMILEVIRRMSELEKTMAESPAEETAEAAAPVSIPKTDAEAAESAAGMAVSADEASESAAASAEPAAETPEPAAEPAVETPAAGAELTTEKPESAAEPVAETSEPKFEEVFEKTLVRIKNGQIIKGSVVQIVDGEVCVNIGYKSDGFIPRSEFSSDPEVDPADVVKVGDEIEVEVKKVNDGEGNVLLSRKNVESKKLWDELMQDEEHLSEKVFEAVGKEAVKGGLIANMNGIRAFIPASQLSTKYVENISDFVGTDLKVKILEVDKSRKRIVASRKAVLLEEAEAARRELWNKLEVGAKVKGVVRRLTDFGAFVDIGGIDGLVHVTDVAWGRVKHPSDVLSVGQEVEVLIRDVDVDRQRVSLGYKQLQPKPWTLAREKYPVGSIVEGKVVRIVSFGAFVALEPTIDGLIHISQVGVRRVDKVEDQINVGDVVRCKVLDVNPEAKRISLSRRDVILEENPEIAEELAAERAEHERAAAQRAAAAEAVKAARKAEGAERRRQRREESEYDLPPVEKSTTSLGNLFAGFNAAEEENK